MPEDEQHYKIFDAKYYGAKSPNADPGWSDLVKEVVGSIVKVTNYFTFSGNELKLKVALVVHRNVVISDESDCLSNYPPIHCKIESIDNEILNI